MSNNITENIGNTDFFVVLFVLVGLCLICVLCKKCMNHRNRIHNRNRNIPAQLNNSTILEINHN